MQLEGNALLYTVSLLTCLGFLLIGFDNGLMCVYNANAYTQCTDNTRGGLVDGTAFDGTFNIDPTSGSGSDMIALIVAIVRLSPAM